MNTHKPSMVTPALIGGAFLGVLSALPILECGCCLWIIGGGILAVFFYKREFSPGLPVLNYGDGAALGALTGVFGGIIASLVSIPLELLKMRLGLGMAELPAELEEAMSDPDIPPAVREFVLGIMAGEMTAGFLFVGALFTIFFAVILAGVGGVLGVAIFKPKEPPYVPPYPPAPPPQEPPPPPPTTGPPPGTVGPAEPPPGGQQSGSG